MMNTFTIGIIRRNKIKQMDKQDFDKMLTEKLNYMRANALLSIPGIYEIVSKHYRQEIEELWERRQFDKTRREY